MTGTLPHFKTTKFFAYLEEQGAHRVADYPEEDLVCYEYAGTKMLIQIRTVYFPCYVFKVCEYLKMVCPEEFKIVAEQIREASERWKRDQGKNDKTP